MSLYYVTVRGIGTFLADRDGIDAAREWARGAFGRELQGVSNARGARRCERCDSSPCTCSAKGGERS